MSYKPLQWKPHQTKYRRITEGSMCGLENHGQRPGSCDWWCQKHDRSWTRSWNETSPYLIRAYIKSSIASFTSGHCYKVGGWLGFCIATLEVLKSSMRNNNTCLCLHTSSYKLQWFLEQQPAVFATLMPREPRKGVEVNILNERDICNAEDIVKLMAPVKVVTTVICEVEQPTISIIALLKTSKALWSYWWRYISHHWDEKGLH